MSEKNQSLIKLHKPIYGLQFDLIRFKHNINYSRNNGVKIENISYLIIISFVVWVGNVAWDRCIGRIWSCKPRPSSSGCKR